MEPEETQILREKNEAAADNQSTVLEHEGNALT